MAVPCKGVRGPLTPIRPRPARSRAAGPGSRDSDEPLAGGPAGPVYRLADYLDRHGRQHRQGQFPPAGFWAAAAGHAFPGDQAALGDAAHARGLYRAAAQLHKNAAASGNPRAVVYLANPPPCLPNDARPVRWAIAHAALDDPRAVASLLRMLRAAGAEEQAAALLARDPAAHAALDDPRAVALLLGSLRAAGAEEQAAALLARDPAAHVSLDDTAAVASLLRMLRAAGAEERAAGLLARDPAAHVSLDAPVGVASLLDGLRAAGAHERAAGLLARDPAAHVSLDAPVGVAMLLARLREAGVEEQVTALAERAAAHPLSRRPPRRGHAAGRAAGGGRGRAGHRAGRAAPPPTSLSTTPAAWPGCWTGCGLRARKSRPPRCWPGIPPPTPPSTTHTPWPACWTGCGLRARTSRPPRWRALPGAGMFGLFREKEDRQNRFRFGRESDGSPAGPWGWEDLD